MILTFLLARIFGTYFIIAGIAILARKKFITSILGGFTGEKTAEISLSVVLIFLGLFVINTHNVWNTLPAILVSFIGWGTFLKGASIMLLPEAAMKKITKAFDKPLYLILDGIVVLVVGLYLAVVGYGLM